MATDAEKIVTCRVAVVGHTGEGPDIEFYWVTCRQEQYDNGDHYEAVKEATKLEGTHQLFDDKDPAWRYIRIAVVDSVRLPRLDISAARS